jgi:hypothetical protein
VPAQGGSRAADAHGANDRIADKAQRLHFVSRVPLLCECSGPGCRGLLMISLDDYRQVRRQPDSFLTAPGHEIEGTEVHTTMSGYVVRCPSRRDRDTTSTAVRAVGISPEIDAA